MQHFDRTKIARGEPAAGLSETLHTLSGRKTWRLNSAWLRIESLLASRFALPVAVVVFAVFVLASERDIGSLPFVLACGTLFASLTFMITPRPRFALFMAASLLTLSTAASMAKFKFLAINAHVFDLWFYLSKPDTLVFLATEFAPIVIAGGVALAAFMAMCWFVWRRETPVRARPVLAGIAVMGSAFALPFALPWEAGDFAYHIRKNHFTSSLFVSFSDIARLTRPSPIVERLSRQTSVVPFPFESACARTVNAPDIILTLSESGVPPAQIPGWKFDSSLQNYFKSYDGEVHRARVETHGGGTWITHTTVTSGLSMADFGWMRPYATMLLRERLHHGLPAALAKCGYKTAIISPQSYGFVNEGPMLTSLGFQDYIDREKLNAPTKHEADSFYFDKAFEYYTAHKAKSDQPLFLFVITMAAHSPYDFRFKPERVARGEPFGNDAQTDEYLRRLTFAQEDYSAFLAKIRDTKRPTLAAQFGDHHPLITRAAFDVAGKPQSMTDWRSPLFETFYALTPLNFTPAAPIPKVDVLDFAYLGGVLLDAAGLPLDPVFEDKRALRALCDGAFHTCADRAAIDRHLSRMKMSGYLSEPDAPQQGNLVADTQK